MSDEEFRRIVNFIKSRYGINLTHKKVIVQGRLDNYLAQHGYKSYGEYMNAVERDASGKELQNLVNILTTNHTYFWREPEHFEYLRETILPQLKRTEAASRDIRIWSAASSSGEEPYTIAMVVRDFFGLEADSWDTTLVATDISSLVLQYAMKGVYLKEQIEVLPDRWQRTNFKRISEEEYAIRPEIKERVMFRQFNLMNPFPFRRKMHVIFLRNVMIYFDEDTKRKLIDKIYNVLEPGGYLIIGTTESIDRDASRLEYVRPSIYRKNINDR